MDSAAALLMGQLGLSDEELCAALDSNRWIFHLSGAAMLGDRKSVVQGKSVP